MSLEGVPEGSEEVVCSSLALTSTITLGMRETHLSLDWKYNYTNMNCDPRAGAHQFSMAYSKLCSIQLYIVTSKYLVLNNQCKSNSVPKMSDLVDLMKLY